MKRFNPEQGNGSGSAAASPATPQAAPLLIGLGVDELSVSLPTIPCRPIWVGFFAGKRFVPIVTAFAAIGLGLALSLVWLPIGAGIKSFSHWAAESNPALAFSIYGVIERLLIPFGLHHIWNVPFFFEVGSYADPTTGNIITDEIQRYIAGAPTAGNMVDGYL